MIKTTVKQKVCLVIFGVLLTLIILECGLRIGGYIFLSIQKSGNKMTGNAILDKDNTYRILCLGESTTVGFEHSWPSQLERILNEKGSKIKFKVFNEAVPGTTTTFILAELKGNLNKYNPHMVITMMGVNDKKMVLYEGGYETSFSPLTKHINNMRVYKLSELLWGAWKNKINSVDTVGVYKENTYEMAVVRGNIKKEEYKKNNQTYAYLGISYYCKGKFEDAEVMFKKAIELDPDDGYLYYRLGRLYQDTGKFEDAEVMFKKAIELDPNDSLKYTWAGILYRDMSIQKGLNKFEDAEVMFKKAIELDPDDGYLYYRLGRLYQDTGKFEDAEVMFKKAIGLDPNLNDAYLRLGVVYYNLGVSYEEINQFYRKEGFLFNKPINMPSEITENNYKPLYKLLNEKKIKYVAMQYPLRNINELKNIFRNSENVIFISNEENFKKSLEIGKYEDYFIDKFAGDFGHATFKGNKLIAENVASVILKELNI